MHHGEQVVVPAFAAGAAVAVADEGLRAEQGAEAGEVGVVHVPHGHAVVAVAKAVVVGHGGDAADGSVGLQLAQQVEHGLFVEAELFADPAPGVVHQRQAGLGEFHQAADQRPIKPGNAGRHGRSPPWAG